MKRNNFQKLDKSLLPDVVNYYREQFVELKIKPEWTSVCCPFHEDRNPSLSINLITGGFHCFSCGVRGGNVIAFHMKRYEMNFIETINFFGAWKK